MEELLKGAGAEPTEEQLSNLENLRAKINLVCLKYSKVMIPSSGLRSMKKHLSIYAKKGITDKSKIPMKSKHLFGHAVDIRDKNRDLAKWCHENEDFLRSTGLWLEDTDQTPTWVHFQSVPYGSWNEGKSIFFKPF
jgi:hypothetical protein